MNRSERALVKKLKRRDERAFRQLIADHKDRVYSVALRMLGSPTEAEDLAQEVFVTVFKSIDSFREDSKLSTWIYRIAVNHSKNRIKYFSRRKQLQQGEYDDSKEAATRHAVSPNAPKNPQEELGNSETGRKIQEAIAKLEEIPRTLIILRDIEELAYQEISEIVEMPIGTVKTKIHRARVTLRTILKEYVDE